MLFAIKIIILILIILSRTKNVTLNEFSYISLGSSHAYDQLYLFNPEFKLPWFSTMQ